MLVARSEKAAGHRLGLSHDTVKHHPASARSEVGATTTAQLVWIRGSRLPEPTEVSAVVSTASQEADAAALVVTSGAAPISLVERLLGK